MKKTFIIVAMLVCLVCAGVVLCACSSDDGITVEGVVWGFDTASKVSDGKVIECSESNAEFYPEAKVADYECSAADGRLVIVNKATQSKIELTYSKIGNKTTKEINYNLKNEDGNSGMMVVANTNYADGHSEKTLVVSYDGIVYYFTERA